MTPRVAVVTLILAGLSWPLRDYSDDVAAAAAAAAAVVDSQVQVALCAMTPVLAEDDQQPRRPVHADAAADAAVDASLWCCHSTDSMTTLCYHKPF
jgi:hypothetical protein